MAKVVIPKGLWVIVPAFNEAEVLRTVVQEILSLGYQVILVDDGSTDQSVAQVGDLPLVYLRHGLNLGQGAALATGMAMARSLGAEYVVHFDADGQHDPSDIGRLLRPLLDGEADIALGSRFLRRDHTQQIPWRRRLLLRGARWVNGLFTGLWLTDAHHGFRALNHKALQKIVLQEPRRSHATELLQQIRFQGLRYIEIPVGVSYSPYARRKGAQWSESLEVLGDLFVQKIR